MSQGQSRRQALAHAARWTVAAAMTGGLIALTRSGRASCPTPQQCADCAAARSCGLPDAVTHRRRARGARP